MPKLDRFFASRGANGTWWVVDRQTGKKQPAADRRTAVWGAAELNGIERLMAVVKPKGGRAAQQER